jgi:hypothetical protein
LESDELGVEVAEEVSLTEAGGVVEVAVLELDARGVELCNEDDSKDVDVEADNDKAVEGNVVDGGREDVKDDVTDTNVDSSLVVDESTVLVTRSDVAKAT